MTALRAVADSSALIGLAQINLFEHLGKIFTELYISSAVYDEVAIKGKGRAGADEVAFAVQAGWLGKLSVKDDVAVTALSTTLGKGEAETIVLANELSADYALMDEKTGRRIASLMKVKTVGVLGVMEMAVLAGITIDKESAVDRLRNAGFRISDELCQYILNT